MIFYFKFMDGNVILGMNLETFYLFMQLLSLAILKDRYC